jgi:hypothetical protein
LKVFPFLSVGDAQSTQVYLNHNKGKYPVNISIVTGTHHSRAFSWGYNPLGHIEGAVVVHQDLNTSYISFNQSSTYLHDSWTANGQYYNCSFKLDFV